MKRSIQKFAALAALAILITSCSDDLDTTPTVPEDSPSELSFLQGEWELVNANNSLRGLHSIQIEDNVTIHKQGDGAIVRAAEFRIVREDGSNKIVYDKNIKGSAQGRDVPNFFEDPVIVSLSPDQLVLKGKVTYSFKKADPVN